MLRIAYAIDLEATAASVDEVRWERIRVGHSVLGGLYRPPAITAKYPLSVDELTCGRYVLGIGAGNAEPEDYRMVGVPTDHRRSRLEEYLLIVNGC